MLKTFTRWINGNEVTDHIAQACAAANDIQSTGEENSRLDYSEFVEQLANDQPVKETAAFARCLKELGKAYDDVKRDVELLREFKSIKSEVGLPDDWDAKHEALREALLAAQGKLAEELNRQAEIAARRSEVMLAQTRCSQHSYATGRFKQLLQDHEWLRSV